MDCQGLRNRVGDHLLGGLFTHSTVVSNPRVVVGSCGCPNHGLLVRGGGATYNVLRSPGQPPLEIILRVALQTFKVVR